MIVVVTGSANGMGYAIVDKFIQQGHEVHGIDICDSDYENVQYHHHVCDVSDKSSLPDIPSVNILINNAGTQTESNTYVGKDFKTNILGVMNCTEKYGLQPYIYSILNQASVSAHTGAEFPEYCASKGAVLTYTKWTANEVAKYSATCNSISCGGVLTDLNKSVIMNDDCWEEIMKLTPLKKWADPKEIAEWVWFLTMVNRSCTGQDIIIDNGETSMTHFIWK